MESVEQKFKVGDRVRCINGGLFSKSSVGKSGKVEGFQSDNPQRPRVRFDDGSEDWGFASELELITPATSRTITLDGITYTLTPVEAEVAEVKREPRQGEVWRWDEQLLLITDENRAVNVGPRMYGVQFHNSTRLLRWDDAAFAYPSLAAAAADGALS